METFDFFQPQLSPHLRLPALFLSTCFPPEHLLLPAEETFVLFKWLDYESHTKHEVLF